MGLVFNPFTGTFDFTGSGGGGGGTIGGSIAATQVAFGSGVDTITGEGEFTYLSTVNELILKGTGDYIALTALNTTFSSTVIDGLHFGQYADGTGFVFGGNFDTGEIDFDTGTLDFFAALSTFHGRTAAGTTVNNALSTPGLVLNNFTSAFTATDLAPNAFTTNLQTLTVYGQGGVASTGTLQNVVSAVQVSGSGDDDNEFAAWQSVIRVDIGTGYTQSTGPVGNIWSTDFGVYGPIGVQPHLMNGITQVINNYYNGDPFVSPSAALNLVTDYGIPADATHAAADTFPIGVGLRITGFSKSSGVNTTGFTTGIQIGGTGSPWAEPLSIIGTGITVQDYTTYGIRIHTPIGSPTASISADGLVLAGTFQPTVTYKSVDGTSGATGSGSTVTTKNGIVTSVSAGGGGADDFSFFCGQ